MTGKAVSADECSVLRRWARVSAIGVGQILSWGSLAYAIAVLGDSMRADLDISTTLLFLTFTLSLLISGFSAPLVGRLIDVHGGRIVLATGSVVGALALAMLALASGFWSLLAGAVVAGFAMAAILYDAAFATLHQLAGASYRKAVTVVTLFGGFASTVFWPLSQALLDTIGWRGTLGCYALMQLMICLPLTLWLLPRHAAEATPDACTPPPVPEALPDHRWLSVAFASSAFAVSAIAIHLIALFQHAGLTPAQAVMVASLMGPTQVVGRLIEMSFARRLRPVAVGAVAMGLLALALLVLLVVDGLSPMAFLFTVLYGFSNGIMTIARGTVPAELYGTTAYGTLLGSIARPAFIARALAPMLFAFGMSSVLGADGSVIVLLLCALLSMAAYRRAIRLARSTRERVTS